MKPYDPKRLVAVSRYRNYFQRQAKISREEEQ